MSSGKITLTENGAHCLSVFRPETQATGPAAQLTPGTQPTPSDVTTWELWYTSVCNLYQ